MKKEQKGEVKTSRIAASGSLFKPLPTKRAFEEISSQIKELVYSKTLKPGDKLPSERELAIHFRTGRMAVREAFRILEQSGLISIRHGSEGGAFVRDVDPGVASESVSNAIMRADMSLEDLFAVRIPMENLIVDLAIKNITPKDIESMENAIEEAEAVLCERTVNGSVDVDLLAETNIDFHLMLARATQNLLLKILMESLMHVSHLFFGGLVQPFDFSKWHVQQHRAIFDAIKNKKPAKAKRQLMAHSLALQENFSKLMAKSKKKKAAGLPEGALFQKIPRTGAESRLDRR